MTAISDPPGLLRDEELVVRGGVHHRAGEDEISDYRRRWEDEAEEDHVRSAIADGETARLDYETLTGKIAPVWDRIPRGRDLGTVLEIGAGYGRIPLYLARERGIEWSSYCALDISETMLRRLVEYRERFTPGETPLYAICASADELPLEDGSVDTVLTSVVFLHMGKSFVARAVAEIARVLRPGGAIVFDASFPNARNPSNLLLQAKPKRLRPPNYMKFWTRREVESLLESSGLRAKTGPLEIVAGAHEVLPRRLGPVPVPLARLANRLAGRLPAALHGVTTLTYTVYSPGLTS
ncbi:MAG: class I SAM-dependent methyltransferase [Gaiellaceae bacterium]